jgi:hypothetical protein
MVVLAPERPDIRRQPVWLFLAYLWGKVERGANLSLGQAEWGQVPTESEVTNHGFPTAQEQVTGFDISAITGHLNLYLCMRTPMPCRKPNVEVLLMRLEPSD